jgi:hypothetical protein
MIASYVNDVKSTTFAMAHSKTWERSSQLRPELSGKFGLSSSRLK